MTQRTDARDALRNWYGDKISMYDSDMLRLLGRGPDFVVIDWWDRLGHSGLSPFALAGISDTSPRGVLRRLDRWPCSLTLNFCCTTCLPVLMAGFGASRPLRNHHTEGILSYLEDQYYDEGYTSSCARDTMSFRGWSRDRIYDQHRNEIKEFQLSTLLRKYGGPDWRKHCTKDFNPFDRRVVPISAKLWQELRTLWQLANAAAK